MRSGKMISLALLACVLTGMPALARDLPIEPDVNQCWIWIEGQGPDLLTLVNFPSGEGRRFDEARTIGGVFNGTIHVMIMDGMSRPWPNYPCEDLWLEFDDPHLTLCPGGSLADANTDINGEATWVNPIQAGGYSQGNMYVIVNGTPIPYPVLGFHFNSPDINGDLQVNLSDVALFGQDYWGGTYQFRSDFHYDGAINLQDLAIMAEGLGASCP